MEQKNFFSSPLVIFVLVLTVLCCCCIVLITGGLVGISLLGDQIPATGIPGLQVTPFDFGNDPQFEPTPTPMEIPRTPAASVPSDTLETLENTTVPVSNPRDLACRLQGICNVAETFPSGPFKVGDQQEFWATNTDTNESFKVTATLRYVTDHTYFWIQNGVTYDEGQLKDLANTFENKIYPTNRAFFGSEWTPGVDEDPHIYVLYASGLGSSLAGYYSSADEYPPMVHEYSNAHEMFLFNSDNVGLGEEFTYGVLAHEFQHMIHWNQDRNEESWINEGFSEVAALLNKYDTGGFDFAYVGQPDLQLNDWPNDPNATQPHYGASFLYLTYFLDRFGEQATQALVKNPKNGFDSVDDVLKQINATDPQTGNAITADDFFMDWAATNYLLDGSVGDGRYNYKSYNESGRVNTETPFASCPSDTISRTVHQYGVDYMVIDCQGDYTLHFEGATHAGVLPVDAASGQYFFWSNKGDESNMTLTREFDFSSVSGPITFTYNTWFDIEKDYDFLYVEVSSDGGQTWQIITTPSGTGEDPTGNAYGWGYSGKSNGWVEEKLDLSQYAGKKVQIRFDYVTDAAVNGEGLMLDNVSIPEINYATDFETDNGGWDANGFVRIENFLPQTFRLTLILEGGKTIVQNITLSADQTADIPLSISGDVNRAVLIISGTTRFTREEASYKLQIK